MADRRRPDRAGGAEMKENDSLTRAERAVLRVLIDPTYHEATNAEKIQAAGVSEAQFYRIVRKPQFREQEKAAFFDLIQTRLGPIIEAAMKTASMEGRDGFNDRKMLLEMGGMYTPKSGLDLTSGGKPLKAYEDIDDGDRPAVPPALPAPTNAAAGAPQEPAAEGATTEAGEEGDGIDDGD